MVRKTLKPTMAPDGHPNAITETIRTRRVSPRAAEGREALPRSRAEPNSDWTLPSPPRTKRYTITIL
jgi:hypothetical protein